ncbi:putative secreted protein (Por secretion system target) [Kordia periserrulae]|uniref:Putative secreted protein (Por secretion system target) n=1 Tax=Kordia periserrulae TaxID=701523 RepID=A0A2T6C6T8_9FLAO|nr:T9SS type A sorting domain-containing protein [Kordia periserrulae]PTX63995.1 putative secreted protein (Por secretion system target) [Kordia periserrulae]
MKKLLLFFVLLTAIVGHSQQSPQPNISNQLYKDAPEWAKLMYSDNPNANTVDYLYRKYYETHAYVKSYHTQYYKRWRRAINPFLNNEGFYDHHKKLEAAQAARSLQNAQNAVLESGNWSVMGPFESYREGGTVLSGAQTNIYSISQCSAVPTVLYCGTESGEIYKTTNGGNTWTNASKTLVTTLAPQAVIANAGVRAIAVHPTNPDIVYAGSGSELFKTTNGGTSWSVVFDSNIPLFGYIENPAAIFINPSNPNIVLLAGKAGVHRTTDGGNSWVRVVVNETYDLKAQPGNPNILYAVRRNTATNTHQFLKSTDGGFVWLAQGTGWYNSTDPNRSVVGAKLAVSDANPNRIYAFLIGDSKAGDNGFIGVYRSDDAGVSWINTMGYDGAPYTATHPNLLNSDTSTNGFNQGFYNCAAMASNSDANQLLVGGIGMWRSDDGGQTFTCIYNYGCGSYNPMHVDMQEFQAFGNEYWATTDGGIFKSNDLFATQPEFKMNGVHGTDFWGFGSGWNRDLLVGGTFHNGVDVYSEGFPFGTFLDLGGGEPASGYVNPGTEQIYSTNIGSRFIPTTISGAVLNASLGIAPTESPWYAQSSEMEFHPSCYNYVYTGDDNQLFKSEDAGATFNAIYTAPANSTVLGIEISRTNTDTMYIVVRPNSGNSYLVKTTDAWATTNTITLPSGNGSLALISLDPENDQTIWLAYPRGSNGNKVFKSTDGGATWNNETSSELNGHNIQVITTIGGTNGGVYVATGMSVFYKNNAMSSWTLDNANLPTTIGANDLRPFYRDGKIRLASYGKGIWESPLFEAPSKPLAKIMVDKLSANCAGDVFYFDDYSMLNHTNATWAWTFENANIATSSLRNPQVTFNTTGTHLVTLTVTNDAGISSTDSITISVEALSNTNLEEDFEVAFIPDGWRQESTGNYAWTYENTVGGFGLSTNSMMVNNFVIAQQGTYCDIIAPLNMTNTNMSDATLTFDVAYAEYSAAYSDGLEVYVSTDCGVTWTSVYSKFGDTLATAPDTTTLFLPTAAQWRQESVDLSSYIGNENVQVKFRNVNGYGQALYVDNINLGSVLSVNEVTSEAISFYPNPVKSNEVVFVKSTKNEDIKFSLYNIQGKLIGTIFTQTNKAIPTQQWNLSAGVYLYNIRAEDKIKKGKLMVY